MASRLIYESRFCFEMQPLGLAGAFIHNATRGTTSYFDRKVSMPRKTIPTRRFRIHQRQDGRYVSLSEHPGDSPLGVDYSLSQAIGTATREATLASREGCKVVIEVQQPNKSWKRVDVINPPDAR